jgi:hypothetical protein
MRRIAANIAKLPELLRNERFELHHIGLPMASSLMSPTTAPQSEARKPAQPQTRGSSAANKIVFVGAAILRWGLINVVAISRRVSAFEGEADISQRRGISLNDP